MSSLSCPLSDTLTFVVQPDGDLEVGLVHQRDHHRQHDLGEVTEPHRQAFSAEEAVPPVLRNQWVRIAAHPPF